MAATGSEAGCMDSTGSAAACAADCIKCLRENCVSASTLKNYIGSLNAVKRANSDAPTLGHALVRDREATFKGLERICEKPITLKTRITGIMGTFKRCEHLQKHDEDGSARKFWGDIHLRMLDSQNQSARCNLATPKQLENTVKLEDVLAAARTLDHWCLKQSQDKVLLTIAALVPAKRADWGCLRIVQSIEDVGPDENALVVTSESIVLVLNRYKTAHAYGQHVEEIGSYEAVGVIRASLATHPRTHLFVSPAHMIGMTNDAFATYFSDCFDRHMRKHVTVGLLRHMWVTQKVDHRHMTRDEIDQLSHQMLHSTEMQGQYFMVERQ